MLRAMIQLAPRPAASTAGGVDPAVLELRSVAEFPGPGEKVYVIARDAAGTLTATAHEVDEQSRFCFPFMKMPPAGPQAGPVIKRTNSGGAVSPKLSTLRSSLRAFLRVASLDVGAAPVYRASLEVLGQLPASESKWGEFSAAAGDEFFHAISTIPCRANQRFFVSLGELPASNEGFARHLLDLLKRSTRTSTQPAELRCPLCDRLAPLGAMGLPAAKINFVNSDDVGFFPSFDKKRNAARFATCEQCTTALRSCYIRQKDKLGAMIAGTRALILPYVLAPGDALEASRSAMEVLDFVREGRGTAATESDLLDALAKERALAAFHVLWASAGDSLDKVTGFITDVPCTRLAALSKINLAANKWSDPVFPAHRVGEFDLRLSLAGELLRHPGGGRTKSRNNGSTLRMLRQRIARAVYLGVRLDVGPLLRELREIIADHLVDRSGNESFFAWNLTNEPDSKKKIYMNAASWIRHVALFIHYLRHLEVLEPMATTDRFTPRSDRLQKLLAPASGVDSNEKMFAFFVGILFGQLLKVQGARKVNVRSNALTWLRRGALAGKDLVRLHNNIRGKFQEYDSEGSPLLREVLFDTSVLGARLGTSIPLDVDTTMYFLFLGQALAGEVFGKDEANLQEKATS